MRYPPLPNNYLGCLIQSINSKTFTSTAWKVVRHETAMIKNEAVGESAVFIKKKTPQEPQIEIELAEHLNH